MNARGTWLHAALLFALPVVVAWYGWPVSAAVAAALALLLLRWLLTMQGWMVKKKEPPMVLDTIAASHFVEKARWILDRLGAPYVERPAGGTLGVFYLGRTVPRLRIRTGSVVSTIGNSAEIIQFLRGRFAHQYPERAAFLAASDETDRLESRLDKYGALLQQWIYTRILPHRDFTLYAWGAHDPALPLWQRGLLRLLYPWQRMLMRRVFRIGPDSRDQSMQKVRHMLGEFEQRLTEHPSGLLASGERSYVDYAFAGLSSIWLLTDNFAAGRSEGVRPPPSVTPALLVADREELQAEFPACTRFIETLYRDEREPYAPA